MTSDQSASSTELITFTPSEDGFYISFSTAGTCMSLKRVQIYYYSCPETYPGLAHFLAAASFDRENRKVTGQCAQNAELSDTRQKPILHCSSQGRWVYSDVQQCECSEGYRERELGNGRKECVPCEAGTYRMKNMEKCTSCPGNRESKIGQTICVCSMGYRHIENSNSLIRATKPCYKPAMPTKALSKRTSPNSVQFTLQHPKDESEKEKLRYVIDVCEAQEAQGSDESVECIWKDKELRFSKRGFDPIRVSGLKPKTTYEITIESINIVSRADDDNKYSFKVTTPQQAPGKVVGLTAIQVAQNRGTVMLKWERPVGSNADQIRSYSIQYKTSSGDERIFNVSATTANVTAIEGGMNYIFKVRAVNEAGQSEPQTAKLTVPQDDDFPMAMLLVAAASGILIVISLVVAFYCCCCRNTPRKKMPPPGKKFFIRDILTEKKIKT